MQLFWYFTGTYRRCAKIYPSREQTFRSSIKKTISLFKQAVNDRQRLFGKGNSTQRITKGATNYLGMKLATAFILCFSLTVTAKISSQTITFSGKNVSLTHVFSIIEKQSGYSVAGNISLLKEAQPVSIDANKEQLKSFLSRILDGQALQADIFNKAIIISKKKEVAKKVSSPNLAPAEEQQTQAHGSITDSLGNPLAGSTIRVKGQQISVKTDGRGMFSIVASAGDVLHITHVGYHAKEVKADLSKPISVQLSAISQVIDEIETINTGYQRISQRELASSVVQVKMDDIKLQSKFSVDQMLAGVVPGLMSLQSSGEPGATPTIRIAAFPPLSAVARQCGY